jgi:uncharacterized membrane protein YeaQ/YmgE (transglycosylase-associated protein family)
MEDAKAETLIGACRRDCSLASRAIIILGIVGAAVASGILSYFGIVLGGWVGYLISGFIGAVLLIWIVRMIRPA